MATTQDNAAEEAQRIIADLRRERDSALAREAALAEVLDIIDRSPGDPGPAFDAILDKARTLCGAEMGNLASWDGEYCRTLAMLGYPGDIAVPMRQPFRPGIGHEPVLAGKRFCHYLDVSKAEVRPDDEQRVRGWVEQSGRC